MKLFGRPAQAPFDGYEERRLAIPQIEAMTDDELRALNDLLPWQCFVVDSRGRRFGQPANAAKRTKGQLIPDPRIAMLDQRVGLADKTVLEIGCFEGIHTIALTQRAKAVKACDSRVENVAKTLVRCAMFGCFPQVSVWDVEQAAPAGFDPACDVLHHVGVLYHLEDPVAHLRRVAPLVGHAIMLDTHYALPEQATATFESDGRAFRCMVFDEGGRADAFSGMYSRARWLLLEDLQALLTELGFGRVELVEDRRERNGARALLLAQR